MIILGLDISLTATGWAIAELKDSKLTLLRCGVITTKKEKGKTSGTLDSIRRAHDIHVDLGKVLSSELGLQIDLICMESMSWPRNASTAVKMAVAWGAIAPLLANYPLIPVGPVSIKLVASGKKSASKEEVASGIQALMPKSTSFVLKEFVPKASLREHCWDALGSILASMKTEKFRLLKAGLSERKPASFRYSHFDIVQRFGEGVVPLELDPAIARYQAQASAAKLQPSL